MSTMNKFDNATEDGTLVSGGKAAEVTCPEHMIVYVLGGPGSGKGTQCSKIATHYGFCHLSAGDLLQKVADSGSEHKAMIEVCRIQGKLVPSHIIISPLRQAMQESKTKKFLIDGFPRNVENLQAARDVVKIEPDCVLFLDCPTEVLVDRLLNRKQGRADDNEETVNKRIRTYFDSTLPVINYYSSKGKVFKVDGVPSEEEVFDEIKAIFSKFGFTEVQSCHFIPR